MNNTLIEWRYGKIICNIHDSSISKSLMFYGERSQQEIDLLAHFLNPGDFVIDVGGNIGTHTIPFAQLVGQAGQVISIEPQRNLSYMLSGSIALNDLSNVTVLNKAVGEEQGILFLPSIDYSTSRNFGAISLQAEGQEKIEVTTIDSLPISHCHLIKIDVEGMELQVVKGAYRTIQTFRPILYIENDRKDKETELLAHLKSLNYLLYLHAAPLYNPNNFNQQSENILNFVNINVLCLPIEKYNDLPEMENITLERL